MRINNYEKQIKIFISYAHMDAGKEEVSLFVDWIKSLTMYNLKVLFDGDLKCGEDFHDFMDAIKEVDCVMILLSPSYKKKQTIRNHQGSIMNSKTS